MEREIRTIPLRVRSAEQRSPRRAALARNGIRAGLLALLWRLATWSSARRRSRPTLADALKRDFRNQTRRMGLRMTEKLRNRLRPRWLRLTSSSAPPADKHAS